MATDNIARGMAAKALSQGGGGEGGTSNYNSLTGKPSINGVELAGNKTAAELKLAGADEVEADRAALVEVMNAGQKNLLPITSATNVTRRYVIHTGDLPPGDYILTLGSFASTGGDNFAVTITSDDAATESIGDVRYMNKTQNNYTASFTADRTIKAVAIYADTTFASSDGKTLSFTDAMFCRKDLYDLDPTFRPYAKSNTELTKRQDIIFDTPLNHNGIFRGKNLTGIYSIDELYAKVSAGDFTDLYLGDYITVSITTELPDTDASVTESVDLMIAAFDYYYNCGNTALSKHHLVLIPRSNGFITQAKMNTENTTEGGYLNSYMHKTVLPCYAASLKKALGDHLLSHATYLTNKVTASAASMAGAGMTGAASGCEWAAVELQLMNEVQLHGTAVWSSSCYDVGVDNRQLPVFRFIGGVQFGRGYFWLRSVVSSTVFASCSYAGLAGSSDASNAFYVRPMMLFG